MTGLAARLLPARAMASPRGASLGDFDWGSLLTTVAKAGADYVKAEEDAKVAAEKAKAAAQAQAAAQAAAARAAQAKAASDTGWPWWAYALVGVGGLVVVGGIVAMMAPKAAPQVIVAPSPARAA